jgi:hypothetical protein
VPVGDGSTSCIPTGSISTAAEIGTHKSGDSIEVMPLKPRGVTPTIAYCVPRSFSVRPTIVGAAPSSRAQ